MRLLQNKGGVPRKHSLNGKVYIWGLAALDEGGQVCRHDAPEVDRPALPFAFTTRFAMQKIKATSHEMKPDGTWTPVEREMEVESKLREKVMWVDLEKLFRLAGPNDKLDLRPKKGAPTLRSALLKAREKSDIVWDVLGDELKAALRALATRQASDPSMVALEPEEAKLILSTGSHKNAIVDVGEESQREKEELFRLRKQREEIQQEIAVAKQLEAQADARRRQLAELGAEEEAAKQRLAALKRELAAAKPEAGPKK